MEEGVVLDSRVSTVDGCASRRHSAQTGRGSIYGGGCEGGRRLHALGGANDDDRGYAARLIVAVGAAFLARRGFTV
jgi:hypothetical protein